MNEQNTNDPWLLRHLRSESVRLWPSRRRAIILGSGWIVLLALSALALLFSKQNPKADGPLILTMLVVMIVGPVLGASVATSDLRFGDVSTLFVAEPVRRRSVIAKLIVVSCAGFSLVLVLLGTMLLNLLFISVVGARKIELAFPGGSAASFIASMSTGFFVGFAIGVFVQNYTFAVVIALIQQFILEIVIGFLPGGIGAYLQMDAVPNAVAGQRGWLPVITATVLWVVLPIILGTRRLERRDL